MAMACVEVDEGFVLDLASKLLRVPAGCDRSGAADADATNDDASSIGSSCEEWGSVNDGRATEADLPRLVSASHLLYLTVHPQACRIAVLQGEIPTTASILLQHADHVVPPRLKELLLLILYNIVIASPELLLVNVGSAARVDADAEARASSLSDNDNTAPGEGEGANDGQRATVPRIPVDEPILHTAIFAGLSSDDPFVIVAAVRWLTVVVGTLGCSDKSDAETTVASTVGIDASETTAAAGTGRSEPPSKRRRVDDGTGPDHDGDDSSTDVPARMPPPSTLSRRTTVSAGQAGAAISNSWMAFLAETPSGRALLEYLVEVLVNTLNDGLIQALLGLFYPLVLRCGVCRRVLLTTSVDDRVKGDGGGGPRAAVDDANAPPAYHLASWTRVLNATFRAALPSIDAAAEPVELCVRFADVLGQLAHIDATGAAAARGAVEEMKGAVERAMGGVDASDDDGSWD